jgi:endonuclease G
LEQSDADFFVLFAMHPLRNICQGLLLVLLTMSPFRLWSQENIRVSDSLNHQVISTGMEIPALKAGEKAIRHVGYTFVYSEPHEQAIWVAYELTKVETVKTFERTDQFVPDPLVSTGTADNRDYEKSGYDRGHLAPAADMGWSQVAIAESFYFSNMSPQLPGFNRGIWKKLEEQTRSWAAENGALYVVTGPVLSQRLPTIGPNAVSVPAFYYKVLLDYTAPQLKAIAFVFPNAASDQSPAHFAVSIDSVEMLTGIDFFPLLADTTEAALEKSLCTDCWNWKISKPAATANSKPTKPAPKPATKAAVICTGKTKSGKRCQQKTTSANGRCYRHGGK